MPTVVTRVLVRLAYYVVNFAILAAASALSVLIAYHTRDAPWWTLILPGIVAFFAFYIGLFTWFASYDPGVEEFGHDTSMTLLFITIAVMIPVFMYAKNVSIQAMTTYVITITILCAIYLRLLFKQQTIQRIRRRVGTLN
jgi:hypothetical protein